MGNKNVYILILILFFMILFFPGRFSNEPFKNSPEINLKRRVSKLVHEKPRFKPHKKSFEKIDIETTKNDPLYKTISSSLQAEINESINQGIKNIRIILNTTEDTEELSGRIERHGGKILRKRPYFMAVEIPADKAEQLIKESSSVEFARLPFKFYPSEEITEGVELTGASIFNDTIYRGSGVKVAIVDVGFKGLTAAIANGDLPSNVITRDFSGTGLQTEYKHGTACAEIFYDMAPDAELHLLKMGDEIAGYDVIDYCIDNNIDIVSMSVGTFGSGPGDGTGPVDEAFDELRDAGILVIVSAGNYGSYTFDVEGEDVTIGSHWEGSFTDTDNDGYHEFKNNDPDSYYNVIGAVPEWNDDGKSETGELSVLMRWNDWPVSDINYDLYLYNFDYENQQIGSLVAASKTYQTGTQEPVEYISLNIPDYATEGRFYALKVKRVNTGTPTGIKMEIYLGGTTEFFPFMNSNGSFNYTPLATSSSSISEPADAESVMAVGAIDYMNWTTGPQEEFSSQGPTNDWNGSSPRTKPDIMGPDGVTTFTYGYSFFFGTSAATPHVAGITALNLSMNPGMNPDELKAFIEEQAIDMGASGKDNQYGWGRIPNFDTDNDGMPDSWESENGLSVNIDDAAGDLDGDEYTNINEFKTGTSPNNSDTDNDGMPDGWEAQYGLNPLVDDSGGDLDGDRFTNLEEYQKETLPNDPNSKPKTGMPWLMLLLDGE